MSSSTNLLTFIPSFNGIKSGLTENVACKSLLTIISKIGSLFQRTIDECILIFKPRYDKTYYNLIHKRFHDLTSSKEEYLIHDLLKYLYIDDLKAFESCLVEYKYDYSQNYFAVCSAALEVANKLPSGIKDKFVTRLNKEISNISASQKTPYEPGTLPYSERPFSKTTKIIGVTCLVLLVSSVAAFYFLQGSAPDTAAGLKQLQEECSDAATQASSFCQALRTNTQLQVPEYVQHKFDLGSQVAPTQIVNELGALFGTRRTLDTSQTREIYTTILNAFPKDVSPDDSLCQTGKLASSFRTAARIYTRQRGNIFVECYLKLRDLWTYRHFDGPTPLEIERKCSKAGSFANQCLCMLGSAERHNAAYDAIAKEGNLFKKFLTLIGF